MTGVARTDKLDFVRSVGADAVLDYTAADWTTERDRYDWIVDVEARHSIVRARRALRPGSVYVSLGGPTRAIFDGLVIGPLISLATDRRSSMLIWWKPFDPNDVARLKELVAAGTLRPAIDRRYPLTEVVEALRHVDEGRARGKVVITV